MGKFILLAIFISGGLNAFSQKKIMDLSAPGNWPIITPLQISNDGRYLSYTLGSANSGTILMIQAADNSWKKKITAFKENRFTEDSKRYIFKKSEDSLVILDLLKDSFYCMGSVSKFEMPKDGNGEWMACSLKGTKKGMILRNLFTDEEKYFSDVTESKFSDNGEALVMQMKDQREGGDKEMIEWLNLRNGELKVIGYGYQTWNLTFDKKGEQLVFLAKDVASDKNPVRLLYFQQGMDSAILLADRYSAGMESMEPSISKDIFFGAGGNKIFFFIEKIPVQDKPANESAHLKLKNYLSDEIFNYNIIHDEGPFLAVAHTGKERNIVRLQREGDWTSGEYNIQGFIRDGCRDDDLLLETVVTDFKDSGGRRVSNRYTDIYLATCLDGSRILIKKNVFARDISFSPSGKYLSWYDMDKRNWFTYKISASITRNISSKIISPLYYDNEHPNWPSGLPYSPLGWQEDDGALIVQDRFDTWQLDPDGKKPPVNITNGFGLKHHIHLRYMDFNESYSGPVHTGDTLFYSALDDSSKQNGFFRVILGLQNNPEKLVFESRMYYHEHSTYTNAGSAGTIHPFFPLKAKNANFWAIERMSPAEYPNLYISNDLKYFKPLTFLEPQKDFNWFTTELHHWKLPDGKQASGILYKPENFNSRKKYPVIFYYYEKNSDALNYYINPDLCDGTISIPWFVSNGYLVFIPDIYYQAGYPGQSAFNSVVSAARFLQTKKFIDPNHMGLQGHSFGGFETNYIVTRTGIFAAAAPSAGVSDLVSYSYRLSDNDYNETGQGRIGASIRNRPDLYFENSPVFSVAKVKTAMLIMHNPKDINVPFAQGEEWYYGLVREGKKAWMLSYSGEGHVLEDEHNKLDYSIRLKQFFDHYLKGFPAPKWMMTPYLQPGDMGYDLYPEDTKGFEISDRKL